MREYLYCLKGQLLWLERVGDETLNLCVHMMTILQNDDLYLKDNRSLISVSYLINSLCLLGKESKYTAKIKNQGLVFLLHDLVKLFNTLDPQLSGDNKN